MATWRKYWRIIIGRYREGGEMAKKINLLPDVEKLKNLFYIDSSIPNGLRWKIKTCKKVVKDSPAGYKNNNGYFYTALYGYQYKNHRIIYSIANNTNLKSDQLIDHEDRQPQNNHPNNLRIVTRTENNRNVTKRKNTSSKYIGVYFHKRNKKYCSCIKVNKKRIHLGYFLTELDAARAYNDYITSHNLSHFNLNQI